jgi:hypothetical protein
MTLKWILLSPWLSTCWGHPGLLISLLFFLKLNPFTLSPPAHLGQDPRTSCSRSALNLSVLPTSSPRLSPNYFHERRKWSHLLPLLKTPPCLPNAPRKYPEGCESSASPGPSTVCYSHWESKPRLHSSCCLCVSTHTALCLWNHFCLALGVNAQASPHKAWSWSCTQILEPISCPFRSWLDSCQVTTWRALHPLCNFL